MRLLILTQNEHVYLPEAFARVCRARRGEVAYIVAAPAMSTHGGLWGGLLRHVTLFGLRGAAAMAWRVVCAEVLDRLHRPGRKGPFHSLRSVARAFGIAYHEVDSVNGREFHELIERYRPDLLVSMSCPQVVSAEVRRRFPRGCINVHGGPLPRYRGLMPAFWVLRNGEKTTAATVHDLAEGLDDGDILAQRRVPVGPRDTWDSLVRKTKAAGAEALVETIERIQRGAATRQPNRQEEATYFSFPKAEDRRAFASAGRRFF